MVVLEFVIWVTLAYFIGNISPSILIGKALGIDIKKEGSGNAGTTNALRVLGKKAAVITLIIDIGKGVLAVWLGLRFGNETIGMFCALAVFCGHIWPCVYGFKGGKGVATAFGAILAINSAGGCNRSRLHSQDVGRIPDGGGFFSHKLLVFGKRFLLRRPGDGADSNSKTQIQHTQTYKRRRA